MKTCILCLSFFFCFVATMAQDKKAKIVLIVENIQTIEGDIHVGVFANETDFNAENNQTAKGIYPVESNTLRVVYENIPYGNYAIQIFHDINKNDKMDSTSLGIPIEPFGFSNDIVPVFSSPTFQECVFKVDSDQVEVTVTLQKYTKRWSAGLAVLYSTSPYKDDKGRVYPIPVIGYQGDRLSVLGPQVFYTVKRGERWSIDFALQPQFSGYSRSDSKIFEGMNNRRMTIEGGLKGSWGFYERWKLEVDVYSDLLFQHKGFHGSVGVSRGFSIKKATLTPLVGYEWQSSDFVDYYFGVKDTEATFERPAYKASFNSNVYSSLSYMQPIKDSWLFMGSVTARYFGDEIQDSPLVGKKYELSFLAAIVYQF